MTQQEIKSFIAEGVAQGLSLSKIQDALAEKGTHVTYMEIRLLASEIETSKLEKLNKPKPKQEKPAPAQTPAEEEAGLEEDDNEDLMPPEDGDGDAAPAQAGKTTVELSPIAKPGTVANGSVKFGSGVTADWYLDQTGRLGLTNNTGKPTETDIMEFQEELQKLFR